MSRTTEMVEKEVIRCDDCKEVIADEDYSDLEYRKQGLDICDGCSEARYCTANGHYLDNAVLLSTKDSSIIFHY